MWGKTLNALVKRAIELVEEAKQRYPEVHINVHVCWFGNELVWGSWGLHKIQTGRSMAQMNSATYGIDPIFDQFYQALETAFIGEIQLPDGKPNPKLSWLHAADYAADLEFKDHQGSLALPQFG